jgi:hypothetical protein
MSSTPHLSVHYRNKSVPLWLNRAILSRACRAIYGKFVRHFPPDPSYRVLDLGVDASSETRELHFFEHHYPFKDRITACGLESPMLFESIYPEIPYCQVARHERLPFCDGEFDLVFCNAVIEHVGDRTQQRTF